jgi:hypothetical protein
MLREDQPASPNHIARRTERKDGVRSALFCAAATFAAAGAVSAESLAQPSDDALARRAAVYVQFREDVAAIEKIPFNSAETTREAHRRLSAHDSKTLSAGWVAYAALVAADTPAFAEGLKDEVSGGKSFEGLKGKDAFFARLAKDPTYARKLDGADDASRRVLAMAAADTARVTALGEAFKAQAYAIQKTGWGKGKISAPSARLSDADAYARGRPAASVPDLPVMTEKGVTAPMLASAADSWGADWGKESKASLSGEPNAQVIVDRVLNLAARYAVGSLNAKTVEVYARNDRA